MAENSTLDKYQWLRAESKRQFYIMYGICGFIEGSMVLSFPLYHYIDISGKSDILISLGTLMNIEIADWAKMLDWLY